MTFFSPDSDNSNDIVVVFNLTNGNSNNLLSPLPNVTLSPNSSQKVLNFHIKIYTEIDRIIPGRYSTFEGRSRGRGSLATNRKHKVSDLCNWQRCQGLMNILTSSFPTFLSPLERY